ncbi:MAG TPA: hypothetical protein VEU53_09345 [Stellaceae bacterium]|nr:hypothetical protein [Stellaceae bacterium]
MVKLAFWDTVNGAYRFVANHPLMVLRTGWFYLVLTALDVALRRGPALTPMMRAASFAVAILLIGAGVAWHVALVRAILLDENSWAAALQFRRRHWRLLGVGVLVFLMLLPIIAVAAISGFLAFHLGGPAGMAVFVIAAIVIGVILVALACRLYLLGPAIATDDPAKAIRAAWHRGRGNTWRLFFGDVLIIVPVVLVAGLVGGGGGLFVFVATHGDLSFGDWLAQLSFNSRLALGLAQGVVQLVASAFNVTFYAFAYRQLSANWRPPPALAALQLDT